MTNDDALSPVIGEMMMIVLALLLVSLFSLSLAGLLPSGRDSAIDITHNESADGIFLWHKGGDWVETSGLQVLIIQGKNTTTIRPSDIEAFSLVDDDGKTGSRTFDLGDHIRIDLTNVVLPDTFRDGNVIRLVNSRNVIFSGTANPR